MTERPIAFSAPMVRAILEGRKTMTRRILKPRSPADTYHRSRLHQTGEWQLQVGKYNVWSPVKVPYAVGERLWVREEHYRFGHWEEVPGVRTKSGRMKWRFVEDSQEVLFEAPASFRKGRHHKDPQTPAWHKRPARFMFRRHSRITIEVTEVRVQRLQEISEADARAEGITNGGCLSCGMPERCGCTNPKPDYIDSFAGLWNSLHMEMTWIENPWVAAISFKRVTS